MDKSSAYLKISSRIRTDTAPGSWGAAKSFRVRRFPKSTIQRRERPARFIFGNDTDLLAAAIAGKEAKDAFRGDPAARRPTEPNFSTSTSRRELLGALILLQAYRDPRGGGVVDG